MRRLLSLLACLLLVASLCGGGIAHAAEALPVSDAGVLAWGHSPGDADEVPADADKAAPHHHANCHGHEVSVPIELGAAPESRTSAMHHRGGTFAPSPSASLPAVRPPIG